MRNTDARATFGRTFLTDNTPARGNVAVSAVTQSERHSQNEKGWFLPGFRKATEHRLWMREREEVRLDLAPPSEIRRDKCPTAGREE